MLYLWIVVVCAGVLRVFGQGPIVTIPDGQLLGTVNQTQGNNFTYYAFRGIPFAKPPTGNLRFAAPVKNDPWTGVWDATKDRDVCTQLGDGGFPGLPGPLLGSEDCLYVSVYTRNPNGSFPVMVWIYGGGFVNGASNYEYSRPDYLLEDNIIFVAFNYRLGVFGFLSTEDLTAPGNWGLKDQILALHWVKNNIAYFGGDPNKITIFGESAGAISVSYLLQTNLTNGLINGAIMQSGNSLLLGGLTRESRKKAFAIGLALGIIAFDSSTLIQKLRTVYFSNLKYAENNVDLGVLLTDSIMAGLPIGVTREPDHYGAVVTGDSHQKLLEGKFTRIPIIVGVTSNEGAGFAAIVDIVRPILILYDLDVQRFAPINLSPNVLQRFPAGIEVRNYYLGGTAVTTSPSALARFASVDQFERPTRELVNQMAKYTNVFYYRFSYEGLLGDPANAYPGVAHAEELFYLFESYRSASPADALTRRRFVRLWTNFVKTGNPTPSTNDSVLNNFVWEPNTPSTNTSVAVKFLDIDKNLTMQTNPSQSDWIFYQGIYGKYGVPPYDTY